MKKRIFGIIIVSIILATALTACGRAKPQEGISGSAFQEAKPVSAEEQMQKLLDDDMVLVNFVEVAAYLPDGVILQLDESTTFVNVSELARLAKMQGKTYTFKDVNGTEHVIDASYGAE